VNDSVSMLTQGRGASGTLAYMSPQQLGGKRASHLDDIYSVGASIYEVLTSKPPFYTGDVSDQIKNVTPSSMQQRRLDLELAGAPIPKEWEETVSACLAKDPNHRPQTAGEIAKRLGMAVPWYQTPNVVDGVRAKTAKIAGGERSSRNLKNRSKLIIAGVIMALLLVASAFAWFLAEQQRERERKHAADAEAEKQRITTEEKSKEEAKRQAEIQARKDAEKLVTDAQSLVKSGKLDQAETLARTALSKVPDFVDAKKVMADVAQARKSAADVEAEKQKSKEEAKQQTEIQARKDAEKLVADAQSLVKSGKLDQAETLARSALSKVPDFVDAKKVIAEITEARKGQTKNVARVLAGKWECTTRKAKAAYLFVSSTRILNFDDSGNRGHATETHTMTSPQGKPWTERVAYDFVLLEFNGKSGRYREFNCKLVSWPKEYPYADWIKSRNVRDFLAGRFSPQFEFAGNTLTTDHGLYHRVMKAAKN
jgi:tetratricopeptide (TPR) repeat protein